MGEARLRMKEFLGHAVLKDLPPAELLDLKVAALEACAMESQERGDVELAEAATELAACARIAAAKERAGDSRD